MKKLFTALTFLLIFAVTLCACDTSTVTNENCDDGHLFVDYSYTAPTCKTNGEKVQKCSRCGFENKTTLLPIDHDWVITETVPSTCSVNGSQTFECSMCHETKVDALELQSHDYRLISTTSSTCVVRGLNNYICAECQAEKSEELPLLEHTYEVVNTATCFSDGELKSVCRQCGDEEKIEDKSILEHEFGEDGYCTKCGVYETLFDEEQLNISWSGSSLSDVIRKFSVINGYLKPKFNRENTIPDTYFVEHTISVTITLYNEGNTLLETHTFTSRFYEYNWGDSSGKWTVQGGSTVTGHEYGLYFLLYDCFTETTLSEANSFSLKISCGGYKPIENTYGI